MTESAEKLKYLIHKRGAYKGQLTLFEKYLLNLNFDVTTDADLQNLESRLHKIEAIYDVFDEVQSEIEYLDLNNENNLPERESFQDLFFNLTSKASHMLMQHKKHDIQFHSEHQSNNETNSNTSSHGVPSQKKRSVRLPVIDLPNFNGTFTLWNEYYDSFKTLIHENDDLTEVQKLSYLKATLKGEPLDLVRPLQTTAQNYDIAWSLLQKRYNNKRRIINNHVQAILDMPQMTREAYESLRQIINITQNHVQCLKSLGQPVESWDAILVPIITAKLDFQTNKDWEAKLSSEMVGNETVPCLESLINFLSSRQNTLETITKRKSNEPAKGNQGNISNRALKTFNVINAACTYCNESHIIQNCKAFLELDINSRNNKARELKLCLNCLGKGHFVPDCKSKHKCKRCNKKHHTLLHITNQHTHGTTITNENTTIKPEPVPTNTLTNYASAVETQVFLSTAKVFVADVQNKMHEVRVLLDSASQSHFITQKACDQLALKQEPINTNVMGINNGTSKVLHKVQVKVKSRVNNFEFEISCLVIPQITNNLPLQSCNVTSFQIPANIKLADPTFCNSGTIDMLIGADVFYNLMCVGQIRQPNLPTLQKTRLGWIVSGRLGVSDSFDNDKTLTCLSLKDLQNDVERLWQIDEFISNKKILTDEEKHCETFFEQTTMRDDETGKFIVKIPFNQNLKSLGDSRTLAELRFHALEKKFNKDPNFQNKYGEFINEYIQLKHMTKTELDDKSCFFLPHHAVLKDSSETTKLRVVFDGSCKIESGLAINETQCTGPTIQDDLFSIIARFRTYDFVLTGDITKMYRQVWIHPDDRRYQRIVWRNTPDEPLQYYELNTVTYGTTAAPFLAIRCLTQIAKDIEGNFPLESNIIKRDFYVDDLLTGSNSITSLLNIKNNIYQILQSYGFPLRKWNSNVKELRDGTSTEVTITEKIQKTLGVNWNPNTDNFIYSATLSISNNQVTKRTILSTVAQLFDPLGILSPILILAKFIIQDLWRLKLNWDETVPLDIQTKWQRFRDELKFVNRIEIPRHVIISKSVHIELHAFSDASEKGYGTCIYLRSINQNNEISVNLLAAKSRVTPLKNVTLPRLELCAAVLSAQLSSKFKEILNLNIYKEYYWCDSQIVLNWLKAPSNKWKTYVANRVSEIQNLTQEKNWFYVQSTDNSADLISRGVFPSRLIASQLWWHGPQWLSQNTSDWPNYQYNLEINEIPEMRKINQSFATVNMLETFPIKNYSSINRLKRIVAFCLRFKNNCLSCKANRMYDALTVDELTNALYRLLKIVQLECFPKELNHLSQGKPLHCKSNILSLAPFLDSRGLIRVGGRLHLSNFKYDKKHPILLPKNHHLTTLIFINEHIKLLHAGPKLLLSTLREQFWPISGKNLAKKVVRNCVKCFRFQSKSINPIMGTLPTERTLPMPPFHSLGLDYAGPFPLKDKKGRGSKTIKCYICLYICFSTKALHLELVTDLTTECFLSAFRRFTARRGKPLNMFSDNGTTFIGAKNELIKLGEFLNSNAVAITNAMSNQGIRWHFIPPRAPHFGGLWEAGVKSVKHHLKRILTNTLLTYEDFLTVLIQIESILNSRPLTPLTSDPNDLDVLTPAHFLIGRPFTTIPDPDVQNEKLSRCDRFKYLQLLNKQFWSKWSREYLNELQQRSKWKQNTECLKIGALVLIKEDNLPPARWKVGRIITLHPGSDNVARVATVKCGDGGIIKRAFSKLCVLPLEQTL